MLRTTGLLLACCCLTAVLNAAEERIRGVLEKTARTDACAQITDALNETYFIAKSDAAVKLCADLMGKRVVVTGVVEQRPGDPAYYLLLKKAEAYQPRLPDGQGDQGKTGTALPLPPAGNTPLPLPKEEKTPPAETKSAGEAKTLPSGGK